ncbi:MAG: pyruvate kinase [Caldivirga sp.]
MANKVKIVATIGPSSERPEVAGRLIKLIDGARVNFSHGDVSTWVSRIELIRRVNPDIPILGDLPGPGVRTGEMSDLAFNKGDMLTFRLANEGKGYVPVPVREFFNIVDEGDVIVMDDGRVKLEVVNKRDDEVSLKALTNGIIKSHKSITVMNKDYPLPILGDRDKEAINVAAKYNLEYLGLSHVRSVEDIENVRDYLRRIGYSPAIVVKVETASAVNRIRDIACSADYVMVARGDLGMVFNLEEVPKIQEKIIITAHSCGKPVMVATQLLESMVNNPVPTRAEVVDVMTSVLQGVDSLLLTDETTMGNYPVEAVEWLRRIVSNYEGQVAPGPRVDLSVFDDRMRFALGIAGLADSINAKIVVFTKSGLTAIRLSRYRPRVQILAGTPSETIARRLRLLWGVESRVVKDDDYDKGMVDTLNAYIKDGLVNHGDLVILTYGLRPDLKEYEHVIKLIRAQ